MSPFLWQNNNSMPRLLVFYARGSFCHLETEFWLMLSLIISVHSYVTSQDVMEVKKKYLSEALKLQRNNNISMVVCPGKRSFAGETPVMFGNSNWLLVVGKINIIMSTAGSFHNSCFVCFSEWKWRKRADMPSNHYWAAQTVPPSDLSGGEILHLIALKFCWVLKGILSRLERHVLTDS